MDIFLFRLFGIIVISMEVNHGLKNLDFFFSLLHQVFILYSKAFLECFSLQLFFHYNFYITDSDL